MKIKNNKNKANYVNYKAGGLPTKVMIQAGKTVDIPSITDLSQIINYGDFIRGFFEIINDNNESLITKEFNKKSNKKPSNKKKEIEDSLDKVEKEVENYTDKEDNKEKNN